MTLVPRVTMTQIWLGSVVLDPSFKLSWTGHVAWAHSMCVSNHDDASLWLLFCGDQEDCIVEEDREKMRERIGKAVQTKVWLGGFGNLEGTAKADVFLYIVIATRSYAEVQLARIAVRKQNHDPKGREFQYLMIFWIWKISNSVLGHSFVPEVQAKIKWKEKAKIVEESTAKKSDRKFNSNMDNDRIEHGQWQNWRVGFHRGLSVASSQTKEHLESSSWTLSRCTSSKSISKVSKQWNIQEEERRHHFRWPDKWSLGPVSWRY